jgi:hypothetical protein
MIGVAIKETGPAQTVKQFGEVYAFSPDVFAVRRDEPTQRPRCRTASARSHLPDLIPPPRTFRPSGGRTPVITPNGASLPYWMENGVKVLHLTADEA